MDSLDGEVLEDRLMLLFLGLFLVVTGVYWMLNYWVDVPVRDSLAIANSGEITGHSEDKRICCRLTSKECWCMVETRCAGNPRLNHPEQCHQFEKTHADQITMSIQIQYIYCFISLKSS